MSLPLRMNEVEVKIKRLDEAGTVIDPDFREARRQKKFSDPITVKCQVNFGQKTLEDTARTHTGDAEPSSGWLVFKLSYLAALGWEPKKGDRVIEIAGRPVDLRVRQTRPESPLRGKFLLLYVVLEEVKEERSSL